MAGAGAARRRAGVAGPGAARRPPPPGRPALRHPHRARGGARRARRPRVGRRPAHPRGRRGAAGRRRPSTGPSSGSPAASGAAARWPRCCSTTTTWSSSTSRPTTSTSRRSPGWPPTSRQRVLGAGGGHPRPLVPRRGLPVDLGGPRRPGRRLRGRLRGVRARQGRAAAAGRRLGGTPPEPGPQGAGLAAPRRAGPDLEAEVPHRRRDRADRRRAAARATGSSCSGSRPSGSARTSSTSRTSTSRARRQRQLLVRTRPGGSARATGSASSASTAPARPRCSRCCPASWRRPSGRVAHGRTVALQHLTQHVDELDPEARVLATVESIQRVTRTADGASHGHLAAGAVRLHRRPAHRAAGRPVRRRAAPVPAAAAAAHRAQRAAARRAHQRPRHRHPQRARGLPRPLARHPGRGLPRPLLPRAGHRLDLGAARRRPDLDAPPRCRRVPRTPSRVAQRRRRGHRSEPSTGPIRGSSPGPERAVPRSGPPARRWPGSTSSSSGSRRGRRSSSAEMAAHAQRPREARRAREAGQRSWPRSARRWS